ncbi:hypothetical protein Tco_0844804, partial [Tanacetum coccineum]
DDQNDNDTDNKDDDDQNDDNADNESDDDQDDDQNDDDDLVHSKLSTFDEKKDKMMKIKKKSDVLISMNVEMPPSSVTPLPPPPIPFIQPQQQTPIPTPTIVLSTSLQNLPTFGSLFKFEDIFKALEDNFSELWQTNQFAKASDRLRDEAQAENEDFINTLDENMGKIIKKQVKEQVSKILPTIGKFVNDQLEAEVLTSSSNQAKISHAVAANLSELKLKKILIDKIENNKLIDRSIQQKTLYKALVDAYETDKDILKTYGDTVTFKRRRDDEDEDEEPSAGSNRGSKRRRTGKELESTSAPKEKTSKSTDKSKEGSKSHHTSIGNTLARNEDPCDSFNELMDTPLDFSAFVMNRLKVDTLTPELLAGLTYELMKGSCKSLVELEYFREEVCKAATDQLDWNNPEGQQFPHDLRKPLPLIPNSQGRRVIPFDHFINNDLAYLICSVLSRTYAMAVTKTKAADYGHIKWIEDFVPNLMWSQVLSVYDKHALWGIYSWCLLQKQNPCCYKA